MQIIIEEKPFEGWAINDGLLWTPENVGFSPGEIRAIQYRHALIAELQRQLRDYWRQPKKPQEIIVPWSKVRNQ